MDLIELHIIQSFPVTCLNRDDVGAPKSAFFGGCQRARVSSQCWKRAIRSLAKDMVPDSFGACRGHFIATKFAEELEKLGVESSGAVEAGETLATFLGKQNKKHKAEHKTDVAMFFSPGEIRAIAGAAKGQLESNGKIEPKKGELAKAINGAKPHDIADVSLFGRMVASDHTLMVEGAGLFSHALSTHSTANEVDFFSAVDEMKTENDEGAGHIGTLEFNAACYYRYVGLNLDMLWDDAHLGHFAPDERRAVVDAFLRAALLAVPSARKNSMFGHNPPSFVLGLRRQGHPLSLANAFEEPVRSSQGYAGESRKKLLDHWEQLQASYKLTSKADPQLPDVDIDTFVGELIGGEL